MFSFRLKKNKPFLFDQKEFYIEIKNLLPYTPRDIRLYQRAFITRSNSISSSGHYINNERLEFLGDTVIGAIVSEHLYRLYPDKKEGELTKIRARIVNGNFLNQLALKLHLDQLVQYTFYSENQRKHVFGDIFEAFIGALFLDQGYKRTNRYFKNILFKRFINLNLILETDTDFKSLMLEWAQRKHRKLIFVTTESENEKGNRMFHSLLKANQNILGEGKGYSKKEAEQQAAKKAYEDSKLL